MRLCYIDESGDLGRLYRPIEHSDQPVFVLGALFIEASKLSSITYDFLELKARYFPTHCSDIESYRDSTKHLDRMLVEIKGNEIRKAALGLGNLNQTRHAIGFLDRIIELLKQYDVRIVARISIKGIGEPFKGKSIYTKSVQSICTYFEHYLACNNGEGICIADSRDYRKNVNVSHSVFTKKFSMKQSTYQRILEPLLFGHSHNHAGLQLCDLICSALLFPIACQTYCSESIDNAHVKPGAEKLRQRYMPLIKNMQYRYYDEAQQKSVGGVVVADYMTKRSGALLFR